MLEENVMELFAAAERATLHNPQAYRFLNQRQADYLCAQIVSKALLLRGINPTRDSIRQSQTILDSGLAPEVVHEIAVGKRNGVGIEIALHIVRTLGCDVGAVNVMRSEEVLSPAIERPHRESRY